MWATITITLVKKVDAIFVTVNPGVIMRKTGRAPWDPLALVA